jgi:hypothetical protein
MAIIAELFASLVGIAVTVLLLLATILAFRNPHRPQWMKAENVEMSATVGLLLVGCLSIGAFIQTATDAGVDVVVTLGLVAVLPTVMLVIAAWLIGYRRRLERADAGQSPFAMRMASPDAQPR